MNKIVGYFTEAGQTKPTYEPGLDVDCPFCKQPLSMPVKTISLMLPGDNRSFFYRVHRDCSLNEKAMTEFEGSLIDRRADEIGLKSGTIQ